MTTATDLEYYFKDVEIPDLKEQRFNSNGWFRKIVLQLKKRPVKFGKLIFADQENITKRLLPGKLYIFRYDPKTKEKLPIWDEFPLCLAFAGAPGGFYGINLHYVNYKARAWLLYKLLQASPNASQLNRVKANANFLMGFSRISPEECTKRYLMNQVRGNFREIPVDDWSKIILLPSYRFHSKDKDLKKKFAI